MTDLFAPLRIPDYRRLLISNGLWWQARWMEMVVIGWLVLEMTNSPWHVALIGFYRAAPLLVVGFFSGSVADRFGRRTVILFSQAVNIVIPVVILLLLITGHLEFWHVALGVLFLGVVWSLDWPTRRSILPDLVGKKRIVDSMLLEGFLQNISRIVGPLSGGALIRLLGLPACFAVLAAVSAAGFLILLRLSRPAVLPDKTQRVSPWKAVVDGFKYVRRDQTILGVLLITVFMNNLAFPYMTLLPVFARDILGQGPVGLGVLGSSIGVGTFMGLILVNRIRRRLRLAWIFIIGSFLQAAVLVAFAFSTSFPLSITLLLISGLGQTSFGVMQSAIVLVSAKDEMRGRAMGAVNIAIGAGSFGSIQIGALASAFGAPLAVGLACGACVLAVSGVTASLPGFRRK